MVLWWLLEPFTCRLNLWCGTIHQNISIPKQIPGQDKPPRRMPCSEVEFVQWVLFSTLYLGYSCQWAFVGRPSSILCSSVSFYISFSHDTWQILSRHHEKKYIKIKILWLFKHTKKNPRPWALHGIPRYPMVSGCKYHIFPMTSSLTQSFMVGFITGLIIWGNWNIFHLVHTWADYIMPVAAEQRSRWLSLV